MEDKFEGIEEVFAHQTNLTGFYSYGEIAFILKSPNQNYITRCCFSIITTKYNFSQYEA